MEPYQSHAISSVLREHADEVVHIPGEGWFVKGGNWPIISNLPNNCVDAVLTDPPWLGSGKSASDQDNPGKCWSDIKTCEYAIAGVFNEFPRLCKPHGSVSCVSGTVFSAIVIKMLYQQWQAVRELIWEKSTAPSHPPTRFQWRPVQRRNPYPSETPF